MVTEYGYDGFEDTRLSGRSPMTASPTRVSSLVRQLTIQSTTPRVPYTFPRPVSPYAGHMAGKGTPATAVLARSQVEYTLHPYEHNPNEAAYGAEAVAALGLDAERVFKTLVADVGGELAVGVVPVTGQLDMKALAAAAGVKKAALADTATAQRATGYVLGGISPLGQRSKLSTFLDSSAMDHPTVYCSAGNRGLEVELAPADLVTLTEATVAPITRPLS